ncbi:hypothetical protein EJ04DRAFT_548224 [Polyplosphaeria fusca]|uniref:Uncharacterized protein n=1 Tax=Polyplosphaeria fusca TaxID=682080 RepID=A0A9P4V5I1_9PLEO|nr:hypothetical protein EJ04DRAFT_548224 [Polyplosphaeria fusca]
MKIPPQPIKALEGDPRWTHIFPPSSYAPVIVITLLFLSIIQIAMGAVWLSRLGGELAFALVLQPLILPCLSFFNTVPSLHLHLYTRTNNPALALSFSAILAVLYFVSALLNLIVCTPSTSTLRSECPRAHNDSLEQGPDISPAFWDTCVALWLVSAVGYTLVAGAAGVVWVGTRRMERMDGPGAGTGEREGAIRTRGIGEGKRVRDWEEEMLTEEQRAERLRKAEEKWKKVIKHGAMAG